MENIVKILLCNFDFVVVKPDVYLVHTTNGKCWVCSDYKVDDDFVTLTLAK